MLPGIQKKINNKSFNNGGGLLNTAVEPTEKDDDVVKSDDKDDSNISKKEDYDSVYNEITSNLQNDFSLMDDDDSDIRELIKKRERLSDIDKTPEEIKTGGDS